MYRKVLIYPEGSERIFSMLHRLLYILIALFTFIIGVAVSDTYQTFLNHGFSPIRRILRIESSLAATASSTSITQVDTQPKIAEIEYTPGIVGIYFITNVDGQVTDAYAVSGDPALYRQGVEAAYQMRFSRRKYRGHPISTAGLVVYKYSGGRRITLELHKGHAVTVD